jgi:hypothetical protein
MTVFLGGWLDIQCPEACCAILEMEVTRLLVTVCEGADGVDGKGSHNGGSNGGIERCEL